jgi:hypothetical protein
MKGMLAPMKIYVKYIDCDTELYGDLRVFTSTKIEKPDEKNCDKYLMKPKCITIEAVEHNFTYEYLYIKLAS